jgi:hypothetical protein
MSSLILRLDGLVAFSVMALLLSRVRCETSNLNTEQTHPIGPLGESEHAGGGAEATRLTQSRHSVVSAVPQMEIKNP